MVALFTFSKEVKCPIAGCSLQTSTHPVGEQFALIVKDLELDVPCKYREVGCGYEAAEEKLKLHEDECGYRKIDPCPLHFLGCTECLQFRHLD